MSGFWAPNLDHLSIPCPLPPNSYLVRAIGPVMSVDRWLLVLVPGLASGPISQPVLGLVGQLGQQKGRTKSLLLTHYAK
jgi:hypothetical protein